MITTNTMTAAEYSDADLVSRSLAGDRDAFGRIVSRYQTLICSLAYSAIGSLGQSEDLSQETFITAWLHMSKLAEPEKLKSWLCGIARNLINDYCRRQGREPSHRAESIENAPESVSLEPEPTEQAIGREEEAILWRSLGRVPELYREPLVLFYREHQSIEQVASALELTEDTVKQRLSRGRKMLQDEVLSFVEGALARTNPGKAFTIAVVAALPAMAISAKAATVGATAVKGSVTAKAAIGTAMASAIFGQFLIFFGNYAGYRAAVDTARTDAERGYIKRFYLRNLLITLALFVPAAVAFLKHFPNESGRWFELFPIFLVFYILVTFVAVMLSLKSRKSNCAKELAASGLKELPEPGFEYRSRWTFLGLPLVHIRLGDRFGILHGPVKAWIAVGESAIGGLVAFGAFAMAPLSIGFLAVGLLPFGAVAAGLIAMGGVSAGVWAFGGVAVGWQAMGGCAIAWNMACGGIALSHGLMVGDDPAGHQLLQANFFFRNAIAFNRYWIWWNLFWVVPLLIQQQLLARKKAGK